MASLARTEAAAFKGAFADIVPPMETPLVILSRAISEMNRIPNTLTDMDMAMALQRILARRGWALTELGREAADDLKMRSKADG